MFLRDQITLLVNGFRVQGSRPLTKADNVGCLQRVGVVGDNAALTRMHRLLQLSGCDLVLVSATLAIERWLYKVQCKMAFTG